ncbi:hypothetical protein C1646_667233 [Rhizophagus diaphanus]|nr:hypothetical protein C1646_667233 [Rhizophagus diaphanus] [Rhizophagus sp. MUCL 43196]
MKKCEILTARYTFSLYIKRLIITASEVVRRLWIDRGIKLNKTEICLNYYLQLDVFQHLQNVSCGFSSNSWRWIVNHFPQQAHGRFNNFSPRVTRLYSYIIFEIMQVEYYLAYEFDKVTYMLTYIHWTADVREDSAGLISFQKSGAHEFIDAFAIVDHCVGFFLIKTTYYVIDKDVL